MNITTSPARRLVLLDIENVCRGDLNDTFANAVARVVRAIGTLRDDYVTVAACARTYRHIGWSDPGWRYLARNGHDGADFALLEVLDGEHVAERFERVVIASGDHIFAPAVARLTRQGVHVTVVAHLDALAASLKLAAHEVRWINHNPHEPTASYVRHFPTLSPALVRNAA